MTEARPVSAGFTYSVNRRRSLTIEPLFLSGKFARSLPTCFAHYPAAGRCLAVPQRLFTVSRSEIRAVWGHTHPLKPCRIVQFRAPLFRKACRSWEFSCWALRRSVHNTPKTGHACSWVSGHAPKPLFLCGPLQQFIKGAIFLWD
jgi:hypothetical protein